jgi:molecular chaperone IbpA
LRNYSSINNVVDALQVYNNSLAYKGDKNMTRELTLRTLDIPSIHKFGIGFDSILDELMRVNAQQTNTNYPPYNIVKHSEDAFAIELAVAGFREGDINITLEKNVLTIKGQQTESLDELEKEVEYVHRGISARNFDRTFTLADYVEVLGAKAENGILTIELERQVPEEQKPKTVAITYNK